MSASTRKAVKFLALKAQAPRTCSMISYGELPVTCLSVGESASLIVLLWRSVNCPCTPQILHAQGSRLDWSVKEYLAAALRSIKDFEEHLYYNGTRVIKVFLHLSKEEQRKRFLERIDDPEKNWKFSPADIKERGFWEIIWKRSRIAWLHEYSYCSVVCCTCRWQRNAWLITSSIIVDTLKDLKMSYPKLDAKRRGELQSMRRLLRLRRKYLIRDTYKEITHDRILYIEEDFLLGSLLLVVLCVILAGLHNREVRKEAQLTQSRSESPYAKIISNSSSTQMKNIRYVNSYW